MFGSGNNPNPSSTDPPKPPPFSFQPPKNPQTAKKEPVKITQPQQNPSFFPNANSTQKQPVKMPSGANTTVPKADSKPPNESTQGAGKQNQGNFMSGGPSRKQSMVGFPSFNENKTNPSIPVQAVFTNQDKNKSEGEKNVLHQPKPGSGKQLGIGEKQEEKAFRKIIKEDTSSQSKSFLDLKSLFFKLRTDQTLSKGDLEKIRKNFTYVYSEQNNRYETITHETLKLEVLSGLKPDEKNLMLEFWVQVVKCFLERNPEISKQAGIQLLKNHIKYNSDIYYPDGIYNFNFFRSANIFHIENKTLIGINSKSNFFRNIVSDLQKNCSIFISQMRAVIFLLKTETIGELGEDLVRNIWHGFKILTNFDHYEPFFPNTKIIVLALSRVYSKIPVLFEKQLIYEMFFYVDKHMKILSQDVKKGIRNLMCQLAFEEPFHLGFWPQELRKIVTNIKSLELFPFKWSLQAKQNQFSGWLSNFFYIEGLEWLPLANVVIQNYYQKISDINFQKFIFFLVCSIIKADCENFWLTHEKFETIFRYIEGFNKEMIFDYGQSRGKVLRIMICSMEHENQEISQNLAKKTFYYFVDHFLGGMNNQDFYEEKVFPLLKEKIDPSITAINSQNLEDKYIFESAYCARQFLLKIAIKFPTCLNQLCRYFDIHISEFIEFITINYLFNIYEEQHAHVKLIFKFMSICFANEDLLPVIVDVLQKYVKNGGKDLNNVFEGLLKIQSNVQPFSQHIIELINLDRERDKWFLKLIQFIDISIGHWSGFSVQHYANIVTHSITKKLENKNKEIVIPIFSDLFVSFINWGLKMEECPEGSRKFQNILLQEKNYSILYSILQLVQKLILCEVSNVNFLPEKVKRFWNIRKSPIQLKNNKTTSLFTAVAFIVMNPPPHTPFGQSEKISEKALSLLTLLCLKGKAEIDYNIYEHHFINDYEKIYMSAQRPLQQYILNHIRTDLSSNIIGFYIDLMTQGKFFAFENVKAVLEERINFIKGQQNDREIVALSRYVVSNIAENSQILAERHNRAHLVLIMDLIVERIGKMLSEEQNHHLSTLKINLWKSLTGIQVCNSEFFVDMFKRYYPLIFSHTNLKLHKENQRDVDQEYQKMLELCLCCKSYLTPHQYRSILQINNLSTVLMRFAHQITKLPSFYVCLFYALDIYLQTDPQNKLEEIQIIKDVIFVEVERRKVKDNLGVIALLMFLSNASRKPIPSELLNSSYSPLLFSNQSMHEVEAEEVLEVLINSYHPINFVSGCNFVYKMITKKRCDEKDLKLIVLTLKEIIKTNSEQYKLGWCYLLLNAVICSVTDKKILLSVGKIIFNTNFMSKLGEYIEGFMSVSIKWPYQRKKNKISLDLMDKQIFLVMLKLMSSFLSFKEYWMDAYLDNYNTICLAFSECSNILQIDHKVYPSNEYEHKLHEVKPGQFGSDKHLQEKEDLSQVYGNVRNVLQIIDEHLNTLIKERYVMTMISCYENTMITTFHFKELIDLISKTIHKLIQIENNKNYLKILPLIDQKVWTSFRLCQQLYYLNIMEEPIQQQKENLNSLLEMSLQCSVILKDILELHKDYNRYRSALVENMSLLKRYHSIFSFDVENYLEMAGIDLSKSYRGASRHTY